MHNKLLLPLVQETLETHGVSYEVIECDPTLADTAAFCEAYGYKPEQSANTIIISSKKIEPTIYAVCVVLAPDRLDVNSAVRKQMGVKKASFADALTTKELTGMEIGGVTAIGIADLPIYVDKAVLSAPEIIMGGGNRMCKIIIKPQELTKLPNVLIVENLAKNPKQN